MTRYISFAGAPGSSKTTQIRMLESALPPGKVLVASVPRLLRDSDELRPWLTPRMRIALDDARSSAASCRDRGDLAPLALDHLLLRVVERVRGYELVALDAYPRGMAQAFVFLSREPIWHRAHVLHLRFPGDERIWSLQRQWSRAQRRRGNEWARAQINVFERKTSVYMEDTIRGIALLREWGVPVSRLDATASSESIHQSVMQALALPYKPALTSTIAEATA